MLFTSVLPAYARTLYCDDFSGSSTAGLHGTVPDVSALNGYWTANTAWKADGSVTGTQISAALPFTPENNRVYELTVGSISVTAGDWLAVGFATGGGTGSGAGYRFLSAPVA